MTTAELPGTELSETGLADLAAWVVTVESLLHSSAAPGLRNAGFAVGNAIFDAELKLYGLRPARDGAAAARSVQRIPPLRHELSSCGAMREVADCERSAGCEPRNPFVIRIGRVTVRHSDFVAQALPRIECGHSRDLADVEGARHRSLTKRRPALSSSGRSSHV